MIAFTAAVALVGAFPSAGLAATGDYTVLHAFRLDPNAPVGVIQGADGNFYGTTLQGGAANLGAVFKMTAAGTITTLHSFVGGGADGSHPNAGLVRDAAGNLYGTTSDGGQGGQGTVFKLSPGGTITLLHHFLISNVFGYTPNGGLIKASDGMLYGTTVNGGSSSFLCPGCSDGTVFRVDTVDGSGFETLFSFGFDPNTYGANPNAGVIQGSDGKFYGTTWAGGANAQGTIFVMDANQNVSVLHSFNDPFLGSNADGERPVASLVEGSPGVFYGTASQGGPCGGANGGTVFKVTTDNVFTRLHSFGCSEDGYFPNTLVKALDGNFYGTTLFDSDLGGKGTVFKIDGVDGSGYGLVHVFNGSDGSGPQGTLIQASDQNLYGTTVGGGDTSRGEVFKVAVSGNGFTTYPFPGTDGNFSRAGLIQASDGNFYGTTESGGASNLGTVFKMDATGAVTIVHSFPGGYYGATPQAGLVEVNGNLYGTTANGGNGDNGTIFQLGPDETGAFTNLVGLYTFSGTDGSTPVAGLILGLDGALYGTTRYGGDPDTPGGADGTIFRVTTDLNTFTRLYTFSFGGSTGSEPLAGLVQAADGTFYGTTSSGGSESGLGAIFRMVIGDGFAVTPMHVFSDGRPAAGLIQATDGNFYGTTGEFSDFSGAVFRMMPTGEFVNLKTFDGFDNPVAPLIQATDGNLYGTTASGGELGYGSVFKLTLAGAFTVLHEFNATDGSSPLSPVIEGADRMLYGTTSAGGSGTGGVVFRLDAGLAPTGPVITGSSVNSVGAGVSTTITLSGDNFDELKFTGPGADSTISFVCIAQCAGPGISVVTSTIKVSADGTTITFKINVPSTQRGIYNIVIRKGSGEGAQQFVLESGLTVNPPPTVSSAGTGPDGTGPLLTSPAGAIKGQTVVIHGANFEAPTTVPSNLVVSFSGTGITVNGVGFDAGNQISVDVDVAASSSTTLRKVTVTNPDLGTVTSAAILAMQIADPSVPVGLAPRATSGTATTPPSPTVTRLDPSSAVAGFAPLSITGTKFNATAANNFVTFTGPQGTRVLATIISATTSLLKVQVPLTATDGPVLVAVSGAQQSTTPLIFTVTNPSLSTASVNGQPAGGKRGEQVTLVLGGVKFQPGAAVSFSPAGGLTPGTPTVTPTSISVPVTVDASAPLGLRDITVMNPDSGSDTLSQAFDVKLNSQPEMAVTLKTVIDGTVIDIGTFLPSIDSVQLTLDGAGKCTARAITPTRYLLEASFPAGPPATLPSLRVTLTSSSRPGTATNDDCEPNLMQAAPQPAEKDWSVGPVGQNPDVTSQAITVNADFDGVYRMWLASWDWLGSVHIELVDVSVTPTIGASLTLPINAAPEGPKKTAADGLTDFEKQRGVYFVAPANGGSGPLQGHHRLNVDKRNFFVRGKGFQGDPTLPAGKCGYDSNTGTAQDPLLTGLPAPAPATMPCPFFQFGNAFAQIGIDVHDVTASFAGTAVFPTRSFADPSHPMLDLATVTYDTKNCSGGASCDHTTKLGPRQWSFPGLGFSTFGTCCSYGNALVLGRAIRPYFVDRPYLHQTSPAGTFLTTSGPLGPMLAPITIVCDKNSAGSDNGTIQTGECSVNGFPGGDVYKPGQFVLDSSVMDTNNDFCVELPFESNPANLSACAPGDDSAAFPQATFQQVIRHLTSHEMGHLAGSSIHTGDASDLMYQYSINWIRENHFSPQIGALIQIHNKGQQ